MAQTTPPRNSRLRRTALLLCTLGVVVFVYLLPQTRPVQAWLLQRATAVAAGAGFDLQYADFGGNAWTGVTLTELKVTGPGVDVHTDHLHLGYFLPSLLTGRLPLSLDIGTVRGAIDLDGLPAAQGSGSPRSSPIAVELRSLSIAGLDLAIDDVPYTLPDLRIDDMTVRGAGDQLAIESTIATDQGQATVRGTVGLAPLQLDLEVIDADLRLARHWFDGIEGGRASGTVRLANGTVVAEVEVADGALQALGTSVEQIGGTVLYQHPTVSATLSAAALGGVLQASGGVDIAARQWHATVRGEPSLAEAAAWLASGRLPPDALRSALTGTATVSATANGWTEVQVDGEATAAGSLFGTALEQLQIDFSAGSSGAPSARAEGLFGGGPFTFALLPAERGSTLELALGQAELRSGVTVSAELFLEQQASATRGTARADLALTLPDRTATVTVDGTVDEDGVQLFVSGGDDLGATLEGAVVVQPRSVSGQVGAQAVLLPGLSAPAELLLAADGPPSNLALSLTIGGEQPLDLALGPEQLAVDLRGEASARLAGNRLQDLRAALGSLGLAGEVELAPLAAELDLSLADTALRGPLAGRVALADGSLSYRGGRLEQSGSLRLSELAAGPLTVPALELATQGVRAPADGVPFAVTVRDVAGRLEASVQPVQPVQPGAGEPAGGTTVPVVDARFDELAVTLGDLPVTITGRAALPLDATEPTAAVARLTTDLNIRGDHLQASLRGGEAPLELNLTLEPGLRTAGVALAEPVVLRAVADPAAAAEPGPKAVVVRLSGNAGSLPLAGVAELSGVPGVELALGRPPEVLTVRLAEGRWNAGGAVALEPLATLIGQSAGGRLSGSLEHGEGGYGGSLSGTVELGPTVAELTLTGAGDRVTVTAQADVAGYPLTAAGTLLPTPELAVDTEFGSIGLQAGQLRGSGEIPGLHLHDLAIEPIPWQLTGSLADSSLSLTAGASVVEVAWDSGWRLRAALEQPLVLGLPAVLRADVAADSANPDGSVRGSLRFSDAPDDAPDDALELGGTLRAVQIGGSLGIASGWKVAEAAVGRSLGDPALLPGGADGRLAIDATIALQGSVALTGSATWRGPPAPVELSFAYALESRELEAGATTAGLAVRLTNNAAGSILDLTADSFPVSDYLPVAGNLRATLDGALQHASADGRWSGELAVAVAQPVAGKLTLRGNGAELLASLEANHELGGLQAEGRLLPTLDATVEASLETSLGEASAEGAATTEPLATLMLRLGGTLGEPTAVGTLASREVRFGDALSLGALELNVEPVLAPEVGSSRIAVQGDGTDITISGDALRGTLTVPLALVGQAHALRLELDGTPAAPQLRGRLEGPVLAGSLGLQAQQLTFDGTADPTAAELLPTLPLPLEPVAVSATAGFDGRWSARLATGTVVQSVPVQLGATLDGQGARFAGDLEVIDPSTRLPGRLEVDGTNLMLDLDLTPLGSSALLGALPLELDLATEGRLAFRADLRDLGRVADGLTLELTASGTVVATAMRLELTVAPGAAPTARVTLAGTAVQLVGTQDGLAIYATDATPADATTADATPADATTADATTADAAPTGEPATDLRGEVRFAAAREPITFELNGRLAGQEAHIAGSARLDERTGQLDVALGSDRLDAVLGATAEGQLLRLEVAASPEGLLGQNLRRGLEGNAELLLATDAPLAAVEVRSLNLVTELAGDEVTVTASGALRPRLELAGTAVTTLLPEPLDFMLAQSGSPPAPASSEPGTGGFHLTAGMAGLHLTAEVTRGLEPQAVTLTGGADLPWGTVTEADLRWSRSNGFGGRLVGRAPLPGRQGDLLLLRLTGQGDLALEAAWYAVPLDALGADLASSEAATEAPPLATATLELPATFWKDPELSGQLALDLSVWRAVDALIALPPVLDGNTDFTAQATLELGGSLAAPALSGRVTTRGLLELSGPAEFQGGIARLELEGPGGNLRAQLGAGGWTAEGTLAGLELARVLPAADVPTNLADITVGGTFAARSAAGSEEGTEGRGGPQLRADLLATTANGSARLALATAPQLEIAADLDLPLRELAAVVPAAADLGGHLRGPIRLQAAAAGDPTQARIEASLALADLSWAGVDAVLGGTLDVAGTLAAPIVTLDLSAGGQAGGSLRGSLDLAGGSLTLVSDLSFGAVISDLTIVADGLPADGLGAAGERPELTASGSLAVGDLVVQVSNLDRDTLALTGADGLAGWRGEIDLAEGTATLAGELATLAPQAAGAVAVRAQLPAADGGAPLLAGSVSGTRIAGLELGALELVWPAFGSPVELSGERLEATVDPTSLRWRLARAELRLGDNARISLQGDGSRLDGTLSGTLESAVAGSDIRLPVQLATTERGASLTAAGDLLGGTVELVATVDTVSGWQGTVRADGVMLGGGALGIEGLLDGPLDTPQLAATTSFRAAGFELAGRLEASPSRLAVDQQLVAAAISAPLQLTGAVWPQLDLDLVADERRLRLSAADTLGAPLTVDGELLLSAAGATLAVTGRPADDTADEKGASADLALELPAVAGLEFAGSLPRSTVPELVATLRERGLELHGRAAASGTVRLRLGPPLTLELDELALETGRATLVLSGDLGNQDGWRGELTGTLQLAAVAAVTAAADGAPAPTVELPFVASLSPAGLDIDARSELGELRASLDLASGRGEIRSALSGAIGSLDADLTFTPETGPSGTLDFVVHTPVRSGEEELTFEGNLELAPDAATGTMQLVGAVGSVTASGRLGYQGLLPPRLAPQAAAERSLEVRISGFELRQLDPVARLAPHLEGRLSGVVQLRDERVVGQLVSPDLGAGGTSVPLQLDLSGTLAEVSVQGRLERSVISLTLSPSGVSGLTTFERFPAHLLAAAVAGPVDVSAEITGALRLALPFARPQELELRLATERIALQRNGEATTGNLSLDYAGGALVIREARFGGTGSWQASGEVRRDRLDLHATATDASFDALLQLYPPLAELGVGANGSLSLTATGSYAAPSIRLSTPQLTFRVAGSSYRLVDTEATLEGTEISLAGALEGVAPIAGRLELGGGGRLRLDPLRLDEANFEFRGRAQVPTIGEIADIRGSVVAGSGRAPELSASALLGNPLTVSGTLWPLDLAIRGEDLDLRAPKAFLATSQVDLDLRLRFQELLHLSGRIHADQARLALGSAAEAANLAPTNLAPTGAELDQAESGQAATGQAGAAATPTPASTAAGADALEQQARARRAALERIVFDDVVIDAPQRVRFSENFGSAELGIALTLSGNAADPKLDGEARILRGTFAFSGRDLELVSGAATFEPGRGIYPRIELTARTTFDKSAALGGNRQIEFVAPRDSSAFEVILTIVGDVEPQPQGPRPFRVDLDPQLSSNALIQERAASGVGLVAGPRALTEAELLSLLTLGRLELSPGLTDGDGLASTVAQGALDTAVDLLVVSELQDALGEALGVDEVEIRTSSVSSILGGSSQPFGVSLRLGGYLSDELFASFRIGRYDDAERAFALTNEVNLSYGLGPVALDLAGRLNFDPTLTTPSAELSLGLRYDFSPLASLETGVDVSSDRQQLRFGVTLRY